MQQVLHGAPLQKNMEMLQCCEQALERQASNPAAARCLQLVGHANDRVMQSFLSNPEGLAAVSHDVRRHNAAFGRKHLIAALFSALGGLQLRRQQAEQIALAFHQFQADSRELHRQRMACLAALQQVGSSISNRLLQVAFVAHCCCHCRARIRHGDLRPCIVSDTMANQGKPCAGECVWPSQLRQPCNPSRPSGTRGEAAAVEVPGAQELHSAVCCHLGPPGT